MANVFVEPDQIRGGRVVVTGRDAFHLLRVLCIFRPKSTTDSGGNRPAIPIQIDH